MWRRAPRVAAADAHPRRARPFRRVYLRLYRVVLWSLAIFPPTYCAVLLLRGFKGDVTDGALRNRAFPFSALLSTPHSVWRGRRTRAAMREEAVRGEWNGAGYEPANSGDRKTTDSSEAVANYEPPNLYNSIVAEGRNHCDAAPARPPARSKRRRFVRHRPLDVNRWKCEHVAHWLGDQRWAWKDLARYQARVCDVGLVGTMLYYVDDLDLEHDLEVQYRLHRKLIMEALNDLRARQPDGVAQPGDLWEYIHDDPTKAALYMSGVLCTPRLTMLWLHAFEYNATLGKLLADSSEARRGNPHSTPISVQELIAAFPFSANQLVFWLGWLFCPALLVAFYAVKCSEISVLVAVYVLAICIGKELTECYSLMHTIFARQVSLADKLASWVCSHMMTPALSMMLAVLHLVFSQVMPSWACSMLFWVRIFVLPPLSIWASWASWAPLPLPEDDVLQPVFAARRRGWQQRAAVHTAPATSGANRHWPQPLRLPQQLDDDDDVPAAFRCPITFEIMREPAVTLAGPTYEREAITRWLARTQKDPITKMPLRMRHVAPNLALRSAMLEWLQSRQSTTEEDDEEGDEEEDRVQPLADALDALRA